MKKIFLLLAFLLTATPFLTFADSFDIPLCFQDPAKFHTEYYPDPDHIRGTCKEIEITSIVSLDPSLQNDYLLAQHKPIKYCNGWPCETTIYSEIIQPATTTILTFPDSDISREYSDYERTSNGWKVKETFHYEDTAILLDKKYVLDYMSSIYKQSGEKLENNKYPKIVLMDRNEMKMIGNDDSTVGFSYDELSNIFVGMKRNVPLLANRSKSPMIEDPSLSIYTFDYLEFGKHIYSLKGTLAEQHYLDFDKTNLPPINTKIVSGYKESITNVVPITSPVKSVKNYWVFTKKDGKIVLAWQKSEYGLDNGKIDVVYNDSIKIKDPSSDNSTNITSSSTSVTQNTLPAEQKKGFFSRILNFIFSWLK